MNTFVFYLLALGSFVGMFAGVVWIAFTIADNVECDRGVLGALHTILSIVFTVVCVAGFFTLAGGAS